MYITIDYNSIKALKITNLQNAAVLFTRKNDHQD